MSDTTPITFRLDNDKVEVLEYLKQKHGLRSRGEAVRFVLDAQLDYDALSKEAQIFFAEKAQLIERLSQSANCTAQEAGAVDA